MEGHIRAVTKMLDDERSYSEIVHQISAVKSSLDGVIELIVDDLVEDCVAQNKRGEPVSKTVLELKQVIASSR